MPTPAESRFRHGIASIMSKLRVDMPPIIFAVRHQRAKVLHFLKVFSSEIRRQH